MEDSSRSSKVLGDLLTTRRRRRFQGRASEVELVRSALTAAEPPFSVLFLHGPGGIGKTSLLDAFAETAADLEASVVRLDGRDISPSADAVLTALGDVVDVPSEGGGIRGLAVTFLRVAGLADPPTKLLQPSVATRVFRHGLPPGRRRPPTRSVEPVR